MNLIEKAKSFSNGFTILREWLGSGGNCVPQQVAQKRTDTCLACPLNQEGSMLTETAAKAIKQQVELRNSLGLRTDGIKSLKSCSACSCHLPLKIWLPIENIAPYETEESMMRYDIGCWVLSESKKP